jgi:hypothetical protein
MFIVTVDIVCSLDLTSSVAMRATLLVRSREQTIATVTINIRQYYTTDPQTDGILILAQDEGDTTREI